MKVYVINMERSVQRRKSMEQHLGQMGIPFEIIRAIDGNTLPDGFMQQPLGRQIELSKSELGCMLSHLKAYKALAESDHEFALVLEDDILITELNMPAMFETLKHFLNRNTITLLTYFGVRDEKVYLKKVLGLKDIQGAGEKYYICQPSAANNLARAGAYIIPRSIAAAIVDFHAAQIHCRADEWEVYQQHGLIETLNCLYPMPVTENYQHGSEINYTRNALEMIGKKIITWTIYQNIPVLTYLFKKRRASYSARHKNIILEN
ncbi:MAG: glycosyltransferase family 25 protein [Flavipsychrobacter sp.]|nr:glycosyltransferase family 25 protein [Flavipsychrobacter sp.]